MYHRIILFLMMFVGLLVELKAQNFNSKQVEDLSYQNFLNGNHEQQIKLIETVLPLGIDYYYLNILCGIDSVLIMKVAKPGMPSIKLF